MKNLFFSALAAAALMFSSCSSDDDAPVDPQPPVLPEPTEANVITVLNDIEGEVTWTPDNVYLLGRRIFVSSGATLNILPGTIIKGANGSGVTATSLIVARGGTLNAAGTAEAPIIFTSVDDEIQPGQNESTIPFSPEVRGLWGGVVVLGAAPISAANEDDNDEIIDGLPSAGTESQIEGIEVTEERGRYGGTDAADGVGTVLTYVSIRFAGTVIGANNELNGLTLGGVGTGARVENIEIYAGEDDGVEFFGGTVNATNIIVNGTGDDGVDTDQAYEGTITNVVVISNSSNSSLELDGPENTFEGNNPTGFSIVNATLVGPTTGDQIIDLRSGVRANISNILAVGYNDEVVRINGSSSLANFNGGTNLLLSNIEVVTARTAADLLADNVDDTDITAANPISVIPNVAAATVGADTTVFGWALSNSAITAAGL